MIQESEEPTTKGCAPVSGEDTIELELTSEQQRALSLAAEKGHGVEESSRALSVPEFENFPSRRTARVDFVCNVTFAVAVLSIAVASLWPASARHPPAPAVISAPVAEVTPVVPAPPQGEPLRIQNAFDASEVFEFPSGTTESEAREAVAELLLTRARERRAEGLALRRAGNAQPGPDGTARPREVFVTRLLAPGKDPWNAPN